MENLKSHQAENFPANLEGGDSKRVILASERFLAPMPPYLMQQPRLSIQYGSLENPTNLHSGVRVERENLEIS